MPRRSRPVPTAETPGKQAAARARRLPPVRDLSRDKILDEPISRGARRDPRVKKARRRGTRPSSEQDATWHGVDGAGWLIWRADEPDRPELAVLGGGTGFAGAASCRSPERGAPSSGPCAFLFGCASVVDDGDASSDTGAPGGASVDAGPARRAATPGIWRCRIQRSPRACESSSASAPANRSGAAVAAAPRSARPRRPWHREPERPRSAPTSVEQLFLQGNQIEDISVLARLPRLYNLHLNGNRIVSLGALSGHPALFSLYAEGQSRLVDEETLKDLAELQNSDLVGQSARGPRRAGRYTRPVPSLGSTTPTSPSSRSSPGFRA